MAAAGAGGGSRGVAVVFGVLGEGRGCRCTCVWVLVTPVLMLASWTGGQFVVDKKSRMMR